MALIELEIPPPPNAQLTLFPEIVLLVIVSVPSLSMPPPWPREYWPLTEPPVKSVRKSLRSRPMNPQRIQCRYWCRSRLTG